MENSMTLRISPPALHVVRLPGESGPILRCFGELSVATAEVLRRELALLLPMGHPVFTLNLSGCSSVDVDGILTLIHTYKELRQEGSRLVVVAGTGRTANLLQFMAIDRIIPVFPNEETATQAVRGGGLPEPALPTWEEAKAETLARWKAVQELLEQASPEEALRQMTTMTALCERSETLFQERTPPVASRCQFCPLFYELGGQAADVGCRSVLNPVIAAVRDGDRERARAQVANLIRLLEEMPLPEQEFASPTPWLPSDLENPGIH
jgi:anti-anti-sigma factor